MIFILHYVCVNMGLTAIVMFLALFLQTYSDASLSEIGTLLMVLPFVSIIVKPLFCALADRQQAHKRYLMGSLALMATGYGSLALAPFFPEFIEQHGRLVWWLDVCGIIVGYSAYGVVWSLGDALAVNAARARNIPWGAYRVWATVAWGVGGWLMGQINENPFMPRYVPGMLMFFSFNMFEVLCLACWSDAPFNLAMSIDDGSAAAASPQPPAPLDTTPQQQQDQSDAAADQSDAAAAAYMAGSVRGINPRLVAGVFVEDIGSTLKSSLKLGNARKRTALADVLAEHAAQLAAADVAAAQADTTAAATAASGLSVSAQTASTVLLASTQQTPSPNSACNIQMPAKVTPPQTNTSQTQGSRFGTLSKTALRRTQMALARMNSLSSASGHAIACELAGNNSTGGGGDSVSYAGSLAQRHKPARAMLMMSTLNSDESLSRAQAARALGFGSTLRETNDASSSSTPKSIAAQQETSISAAATTSNKSLEDLQLVLLKLIVRRDKHVLKYLATFTVLGLLMNIHLIYFFLHVEQLCREKDYDFSVVTGYMLVAQASSEVFSFLVLVPHLMPRIGRTGSFFVCALIYATRYAFYGSYYAYLSPYTAIITETCHGFAYGMVYTLVTDIASECVEQVDAYLPELIKRRIVEPTMNPQALKLPLRATMQGVFSGAFDGLGNGLGALAAGIYLDSYSYASLWLICAMIALVLGLIYPLGDLRAHCAHRKRQQQQQQNAPERPMRQQRNKSIETISRSSSSNNKRTALA